MKRPVLLAFNDRTKGDRRLFARRPLQQFSGRDVLKVARHKLIKYLVTQRMLDRIGIFGQQTFKTQKVIQVP